MKRSIMMNVTSEKSTDSSSEGAFAQSKFLKEHDSPLQLTEMDLNRIIEMAWEDRTPFDAIKIQFGLNENEVKSIMKSNLKFKSYVTWRKRVEACQTKHVKKRNETITRFKCSLQRSISLNKISKRKKN